jgi:hypothetical protein
MLRSPEANKLDLNQPIARPVPGRLRIEGRETRIGKCE